MCTCAASRVMRRKPTACACAPLPTCLPSQHSWQSKLATAAAGPYHPPPLHVQESLDAALLRELGEARMAQLVTRTGSPLKVCVCGGGGYLCSFALDVMGEVSAALTGQNDEAFCCKQSALCCMCAAPLICLQHHLISSAHFFKGTSLYNDLHPAAACPCRCVTLSWWQLAVHGV